MLRMGFRMVAAAAELYSAEGPEGLSLRKLGARLGVSPSTLYKHFRSRAELLDSIAAQGYCAMEGYFDRHPRVQPARARLEAITADALDFALGSPRLFKLMYDDARRPGVAHQIPVRRIALLIQQVAREEPEQIADPVRPTELAHGWLALIVGCAALHRAGMFDEETLRQLCCRAGGRVLGLA